MESITVSTLDDLNGLQNHGLADSSEVLTLTGLLHPSAISQHQALIELVTGKPINKATFPYGQYARLWMNLSITYSQAASNLLQAWLHLREIAPISDRGATVLTDSLLFNAFSLGVPGSKYDFTRKKKPKNEARLCHQCGRVHFMQPADTADLSSTPDR